MGKKSNKKPAKTPKDELEGLSVEELVLVGQQLYEQLNIENAEKCYKRALQINPNHVETINNYANLLLDAQDYDAAKTMLEKSMSLEPNANHWKYLSYAQLHTGVEAIKLYQRGIQLLKIELEQARTNEDQEEIEGIIYQISGALCSVAEIYMTDECFAEEAEREGERCLLEAMEMNKEDPQPGQVLCSLRMSQCKNEEALASLEKSYSLWAEKELEELPDLEFRHNCGKLFLELEESELAIEIWENILDEDDQIAEVHYFLGISYRSISSSRARDHVMRAKELLDMSGDVDLTLKNDIKTLVLQLKGENVENIPEDIEGEFEEEEDEDEDVMDQD